MKTSAVISRFSKRKETEAEHGLTGVEGREECPRPRRLLVLLPTLSQAPVSSSCGHFDVALLHQPLCSHVALKNFYLTRSAPILAVTESPALSVGLGLFPGVGQTQDF